MKKLISSTIAVFALLSGLFAALAIPGVGEAQPPTTDTFHETFSEVEADTICGEDVLIDTEGKSVFHITEFDDGRYHFTGTGVGRFSFELSTGEVFTGRFTFWFGENLTSVDDFNATFTFNATGKGDEGTHVMLREVAHVTIVNGEIVVEFDTLNSTCR